MIELDSKYTYERYKKYYKFSMFRGKNYKRRLATFPLVTVLSIFIAVLSFVWINNNILTTTFIFVSLIYILIFLLTCFMPRYYVKRSPILFDSSIKFIFGDECFTATQTGGGSNGTNETKYSVLLRVYETEDSFYLYLTPAQAYLLSKDDFVTGTPLELRELLQRNLEGKKYIICK